MKKLIVNRAGARRIRDAETTFTLTRAVTDNDATSLEFKLNKRYPIGARFWVAEPICSIIREVDQYRREWFGADNTPEGFRRYTLDRPGTRVHFGEHRFEVEVVSHGETHPHDYYKYDWAEITFKKVELEL